MKIEFEVDADTADEITRQTLLWTYNNMVDTTVPVWDMDPVVEERKQRKFKKALRKVLNYYSEPEDQVSKED